MPKCQVLYAAFRWRVSVALHLPRPLQKQPKVAALTPEKFPELQKPNLLHLHAAVGLNPPQQIRTAPGSQPVPTGCVPHVSQHVEHCFNHNPLFAMLESIRDSCPTNRASKPKSITTPPSTTLPKAITSAHWRTIASPSLPIPLSPKPCTAWRELCRTWTVWTKPSRFQNNSKRLTPTISSPIPASRSCIRRKAWSPKPRRRQTRRGCWDGSSS